MAEEEHKSVIAEFKDFILRGNVVDLAVAVVVGAAFGAVVNALVKDIITPIIAAIAGKPDFSALTFRIHRSKFLYGDLINAVIEFISIAAAVFFLVIKPVNYLTERLKKAPDPESADRACPECLSLIPKEARRCSFCTVEVTPVA
jgi:large conductance mechanosensitive channel